MKTFSDIEIFFSWDDVVTFIDGYLADREEKELCKLDITLLPSGGYRTRLVFAEPQLDLFEEPLFGSEEDA